MDLERAHLLLNHNRRPIRIAIKPPSTPTWQWMGKICGELAHRLGWGNRPAFREYIQQRLGRTDPALGETFLTEISPIPAKKTTDHRHWRDCFRQIEPETDQIIETRFQKLYEHIDTFKPSFIFCYGRPCGEIVKDRFCGRSWRSISTKSEMSMSEDGRFIVLMPFFGNGQLGKPEIDAVISEVGKRCRAWQKRHQ